MDIKRLKELSGLMEAKDDREHELSEDQIYNHIEKKVRFALEMRDLTSCIDSLENIETLTKKLLKMGKAEEKSLDKDDPEMKHELDEDKIYQHMDKKASFALRARDLSSCIDALEDIREDISKLRQIQKKEQLGERADKFESNENSIYDKIERKISFIGAMNGFEAIKQTVKEIEGLVQELINSNKAEEKAKAGDATEDKAEPAEDRVYQDMKRRITSALASGERNAISDALKSLKDDLAKLRKIQRSEIRAGNNK